MSSFYLSDSLVLKDNRLSSLDFRIYSYLCSEFNIQTLKPFVRLLDIKGFFQLTKEQVETTLQKLSALKVNEDLLLKVKDNGKYLEFDMPRHRTFLKSIGFEKFNSSRGWNIVKQENQSINLKKYKYVNLDQHQLYDKLRELPVEELQSLKETDLLYGWVLRNVKKDRNIN